MQNENDIKSTASNSLKDKEPELVECINCGNIMINACRSPCPKCGYQMECS